MAYEETQRRISLDADSSLALYTGISGMPGAASPNYGHLYSGVKITGTHTCGLAGVGDDQAAVGVLQNKPQKLGEACEIAFSGVTLLIAGVGGLTAGDRVKLDANGHGVTQATGTSRSIAKVIIGAAEGAAAAVFLDKS